MAAASANAASKVIGAGSYGIVVYPALMDVSKDGTRAVKHPNMATKLFYTKKDYDAAFIKYNAMRAKLPHIMYKMLPYKRTFITSDFSKNSEFMEKYTGKALMRKSLPFVPRPFYAAAIPYLGMDLSKIIKDSSMVRDFLRIPEKDIVREVYNIFYKVKQIRDVGLMHSDIKTDNIVFNFETNKFNLIDTDSITAWESFMDNYDYKIGEYYPPEFYVVWAGPERLERAYMGGNKVVVNLNIDTYASQYYSALQSNVNRFINLPPTLQFTLAYSWIKIQLADELKALLADGPRIGATTAVAKYDLIEKICKDGFDSYCLSLALFQFFNKIRTVGNTKKYEYLTNTIMAGGISRHFYSGRSNLDTILLQLKNYYKTEHGDTLYMPLPRSRTRSGSRSSGSGKTRRSKSHSPSLPKGPSKG